MLWKSEDLQEEVYAILFLHNLELLFFNEILSVKVNDCAALT